MYFHRPPFFFVCFRNTHPGSCELKNGELFTMSRNSKCVFNRAWEEAEDYKNWVKALKGDNRKAVCVLCQKAVDVSSMGESALKSHMKSEKHRKCAKSTSMALESFFTTKREESCDRSASSSNDINNNIEQIPAVPMSATPTAKPTQSQSKFQLSEDVIKAELMWTMKLVTDHQSYKSSETASQLFQVMFPDSNIAKQFKCGERKSAYLAVYGLGEHFRTLLKTTITGPYTVLFDESLNHKMQTKQMDIHIRFWNDTTKKVETRFFNTVTLGKLHNLQVI